MLFRKVDYTLGGLIQMISGGQLSLPEIQRPFVWKNVTIRDLLDSMYLGYPIGFLLFWQTDEQAGRRRIGTNLKQHVPSSLIVDGQQRLTSLYAVLRGQPVVREDFTVQKIEIAFNPLERKFEVPDAAIRRDPRFIADISVLWDPAGNVYQFSNSYFENLKAQSILLTPDEISQAQLAIGRLFNLENYPFTVLEISSEATAQQVSDIFVRINSKGKKLNQADFILTLMSVFWDEGRTQLETFCRDAQTVKAAGPSPFNHLFRPKPEQMLRVAIAVGFRRARLSAVYAVLRGRDIERGEEAQTGSAEDQFDRLKKGQAVTLDTQYWQDFLQSLRIAGYRSDKIISSGNTVVFAYAFYLIGRTEFKVPENELRKAIAQWFFMSSLTGRFTGSAESQMENDLARLRSVNSGVDFLNTIKNVCASTFTNDFWTTTLPTELATPSAASPSMFAFFAALNVLDARALFSEQSVRELMDPAVRGTKSSLERHHLFPAAYLKKIGFSNRNDYNQIANFSIVEWGDNASISNAPPTAYVANCEKRFDARVVEQMRRHHALPPGWEQLNYEEFLRQRRVLMAQTIREAYEKLSGQTAERSTSLM